MQQSFKLNNARLLYKSKRNSDYPFNKPKFPLTNTASIVDSYYLVSFNTNLKGQETYTIVEANNFNLYAFVNK
jgi:hypothetical protein